MKKQFPWFEVILIVVFMSIQFYAAFSDGYNFPNTWFSRDDAYYYFKVAQNISEGRGSTFDGIHPTNGYHPLWMLICVPIFALARFDLILPLRVMLVVMSGFALITAILLYRLIKETLSIQVAMLAAIYWVFDFYVQIVFYRQGLESGIALFFIVLMLYKLSRLEKNWRRANLGSRQIAALGIVAALATFSRLDLAFFFAIIGVWIVFRDSPIHYLLPLDILAILVSTLGAFIWRLGFPGYYNAVPAAITTIIASMVVSVPVFYFFGLYQRASSWNSAKILQRTVLASLVSNGLTSALLLIIDILHVLQISPVILVANTIINLLAILLIRFAAYGLGNKSQQTDFISPIQYLKNKWLIWLKEGSAYYGVLGGALSIYMIWNKAVFGTFTPVSGQIKRWWASSAINIYGGQATYPTIFIGLDPQAESDAWQPLTTYLDQWYNYIYHKYKWAHPIDVRHAIYPTLLIAVLIAVCLIFLAWRQRTINSTTKLSFIPLVVGSWVQILSFSITGYSSPKEWYWLTEQLVLLFMTLLLIELPYKFLSKKWKFSSAVLWAVVVLYGVNSVLLYSQDVYARMPYGYSDPNRPYIDVLPFLETLTHSGDVIGMTGGGNVGYFIHDRTIVNMDGLINSFEYFQALKNGTSGDYLYNTGMRYVFANPDIINSAPYRGQYDGRLQPIIDWGGKYLFRLLPKPSP